MISVYKYSKPYKSYKEMKESDFKFIRKFNISGEFKSFIDYIKQNKTEHEKIIYSGSRALIVYYRNDTLDINELTKYSLNPPTSKEWL